jgi:hypothetical protein
MEIIQITDKHFQTILEDVPNFLQTTRGHEYLAQILYGFLQSNQKERARLLSQKIHENLKEEE